MEEGEMDYKFVDLKVEDNVAMLGLARTESLNALSLEFAQEITEAVRELNDRDDVRVIILASHAKAFCVGLDLKDFTSLGLDGAAKSNLDFPEKLHYLFDCCNILEECRKPVIAAVHGMCIGGGLDIISASDIRLCTEDATFSLREAAIGIVADLGVLQRLPLIIGQGFTREMAYTARFFSAREVERMGLINTVYTDYDTMVEGAKKLAVLIATNPPLAVQSTKDILNSSRFSTIQNGMSYAKQKNMVLFTSEDLREAISAFAEKRKPDFKGR
jgi:enoyl-CoA hydratase